MNKTLIKEKQRQAASILKEKDVDLWMTFVRESATNHDPALDVVVGANATWPTAFCIDRDGGTTAILGSLEVANMEAVGTFETITGYLQSVKEPLLDYLNKLDPKKIAINYSPNMALADGLTHGLHVMLEDLLKGTPYMERMISSEEIIASLRGRKSPAEIDLMKKAIKETLEIFKLTGDFIAPGKTEKEVADFVLEETRRRGFEQAWDPAHCPAIFSGPDTAGAHAEPTERVIEKGHVINMDFGIKYDGYCSDLQRTWYILRDGEDTAPPEVQRGFDVIVEAITRAANALKPGVRGCEVDDAARNYIEEQGYEGYPHGLGHQVGTVAHDAGPGLFPRWDRYGSLPYMHLEKGLVFTIEPRLTIDGFGIATVEEEVQITEDGCEFLSDRQTKLYVLKR